MPLLKELTEIRLSFGTGRMVAVGSNIFNKAIESSPDSDAIVFPTSDEFFDPTSTVTVPIPDHKEIRIGTLASIIRQSGVPRSEFE